MDTPDWPGINHMVHYRWGLIRFENSLEPGKRKRLKELFDEEVPALKKIKLSDILLTEEDIMTLDIGWDEALLERLQPANEPANHKRTTDDLLISLPQHHRFTTTGDNVEFSIQPKQRAKSEEPTLEACARQARQRYLDEAAHLPVEHDDSEMPATRARGKKRTHSVSQEDVVDLSSDTAPALPESGKQEEQEGGGEAAAEVSDTESIVISAKRIKPNSGEKVQEQSGTPDPQNPAKTVSTGNAGTLKSALDLQEGKGENASVEGNECGRKETNESQAPAKKWSYFDGYKTRKPSNIRDFGNPRPVAPVPGSSPSREHRSMAPLPGGPKPVNRLGNNASNQRPNPNPQYKKPESSNGYNPSKQKDPLEKAFNLRPEQNRSDGGQSPSKRQRIEGTSVSHNGTSRSPIDLEASPATNGKATGTQTTSSQNQNQKRSEFEVEEYGSLEKMMKPKPQRLQQRKSSSSESQTSSLRGGQQTLKKPPFKGTVVRHSELHDAEDQDDPISDLEILETDPGRKSKPQVVIEPTPYRGSAFREPPRSQLNGAGSKRSSVTTARSQEVSPYFPPPVKSLQQKQESGGSHSAGDTTANRTSARVSGPPNGVSRTKTLSSRSSSVLLDADVSLDELNSEDPSHHRATADGLLGQQKTANAASEKSTVASKRNRSVNVDDSSDDALANDKANIVPTTFVSTKKRKDNKAPKDEQYDAQLIFSEVDAWLVDEKHGPWLLVHNPILKTLELFNGGNNPLWKFPTGKIEKIECNTESKIMVIHKARDLNPGKGIRLYIKLRHSDQSNDLRESLKTSQSTIQLLKKPIPYLHSVVDNMLEKVVAYQEKSLATAKKRRSSLEEPEDIKLIAMKSQRRLEAKRATPQESSTSSTGRRNAQPTTQDEEIEKPRSRGLANGMRTRSSSDRFENDDLQHGIELPEVTSEVFYGKSTPRRENASFLHETRSATRGQDRDSKPRQLRPRKPSPPPLRSWTKDNSDWTRLWHNSIIYPATGKDRARVDMGDIEKLDDGEFLNDNLIVFYLRWLQDQIERNHPEMAKRIYFQNTFFYQKLAKSEKGTKSINYEAVKKWTSKVDLLSKDYIIIPINEHAHWYVAIICNAPKLLPGAEAMNSSQSQDADTVLGAEPIKVEDEPKYSSAPDDSPKQIAGGAKGGDVDVVMKDMSLEDEEQDGIEELPSVPKGVFERHEVAENDDPPPANVISDLLESEPAKPNQTKKSRRKSGPPPRKHNPKEFRIITLDSLGGSHTVTCSNLKDYLVMEIKDKKNIDIERPGSIGTTAKGIPMQNNYYDCGLFLLSYVEMFLKSPDEFISGILQPESGTEYRMRDALAMREHIRKLLFHLQAEQHAEAEQLAKLKGKGKRSSKPEDKPASASTSKLSSREASKSARASPDGVVQDESGDLMEQRILPKGRPPKKEEITQDGSRDPMEMRVLPKSRPAMKDDSTKPPMSPKPEILNGAHWQASAAKKDESKPEKLQPQEEVDLGAASQEVAKLPGGIFNRFLSGTTNLLHGFLNHEKSATSNVSNHTSATDAFEIEESPQKMDSRKSRLRSRDPELEDSFRTLVGNGQSVVEPAGQVKVPRSRRHHNAQTPRESSTVPNSLHFASPTPDALDHPHRTPAEYEVTDLRTPSPESAGPVRNSIAKAQRQASSVRKANGSASMDRRRVVKASNPEIMQTPSPGTSDRRSSRYLANGAGYSSGAEIDDSEGEDDDMLLIDPEPSRRTISKREREVSEHDAEMLLPSTEPQDEVVEDADPSLLSSSPPSTSETGPVSGYREGGRSAPSSPNLKYEGRRRSLSSGANRGTKRKTPGTGETDDWQGIRRPSPALRRDGLDQAIIGRHRPSGKHTRFPL